MIIIKNHPCNGCIWGIMVGRGIYCPFARCAKDTLAAKRKEHDLNADDGTS